MWNIPIQNIAQHPLVRFAGGGSRARRSRLQRFCQWQLSTARRWDLPDLAAWRDHLLQVEKLNTTTVLAYLSTVRGAYQQLTRSNEFYQWLAPFLAAEALPDGRLALLAEFQTRLNQSLDPKVARVPPTEGATPQLWLKPDQVTELIQAPGLANLKACRDTALIALLLTTGLRTTEVVALDVVDLRKGSGSAWALQVRSSLGVKPRLILYGTQDWGLRLTEAWLARANLKAGPVFVGLRKGDHFYLDAQHNPQRLSERSVEYALQAYPIFIEGRRQTITSQDLRRTYARQLYRLGMDLLDIQHNMGHDCLDTTLGYIGPLDVQQHSPQDTYATTWLESLLNDLNFAQTASDFELDWTEEDKDLLMPSSGEEFSYFGLDFAEEEAAIARKSSPSSPQQGGYVFKIWLEISHPQIWRRFKVPAGISFRQLHDIIQVVMGWQNYHLYRFGFDFEAFMEDPMGSGDQYASRLIDGYFSKPATMCFYEYDFGDSWGHLLQVEKILKTPVAMPICQAGNRACPPEDSGGPFLYAEFLRSRKNRKGRVSRKWQDFYGSYWDADAFDRQEINQQLVDLWADHR